MERASLCASCEVRAADDEAEEEEAEAEAEAAETPERKEARTSSRWDIWLCNARRRGEKRGSARC